MPSISRSLLLWAGIGLSLFIGTDAAAAENATQTVRATPQQMLSLADDLAQRGEVAATLQILEILSEDPDPNIRNESRYRRAILLRGRGANSEAALLLREVVDEKPKATAARLELAQLLDNLGDKDGAWRQIRAVQASGLPADVARIVDRYSEALRAARPIGASFEIALAPDSNISRATRSDTLGTVLGDFTIGKDSQATSGTGLALQGQAFRRLPLGTDDNVLFRVSAFANIYRKSRFNDLAFDLAAGPELQWGRNRLNLEVAAAQRWFGQEPYERSVRVNATFARPIGRLAQLRLRGSAALVDNRLNNLQDGRAYFAQASFERALSATTGIAITLSGGSERLNDPGFSTRSWQSGLTAWRDLGRTTVTAEFEYGRLEADERLSLFPDKRSDDFKRFALGATLRQFSFHGFAPVMRLTFERSRSTIEFYDYRRTRTEFGLSRAF